LFAVVTKCVRQTSLFSMVALINIDEFGTKLLGIRQPFQALLPVPPGLEFAESKMTGCRRQRRKDSTPTLVTEAVDETLASWDSHLDNKVETVLAQGEQAMEQLMKRHAETENKFMLELEATRIKQIQTEAENSRLRGLISTLTQQLTSIESGAQVGWPHFAMPAWMEQSQIASLPELPAFPFSEYDPSFNSFQGSWPMIPSKPPSPTNATPVSLAEALKNVSRPSSPGSTSASTLPTPTNGAQIQLASLLG